MVQREEKASLGKTEIEATVGDDHAGFTDGCFHFRVRQKAGARQFPDSTTRQQACLVNTNSSRLGRQRRLHELNIGMCRFYMAKAEIEVGGSRIVDVGRNAY